MFALAACEQQAGLAPTAESQAPAAAQSAPAEATAAIAPAPSPSAAQDDPTSIYKIARVAPTIRDDADVGWFAGSEGSPRQVGAFVGASVIEGVETIFTGDRPVALEVDIRQFRPAVALQRGSNDAVHRVKLDFIFRDEATGEVIGRADGLFMDLVALVGTAGAIARNAGRTPEVRLAERIKRMTAAWSRDASCEVFACPRATAVAAAPAPAPAPEPAPATAPEPAPQIVEAAPADAPAPAPVETAPVETAPVETAAAPEADGAEPKSFFEELAAALEGDAPSEPEAAVAETEAPAPAPQPIEPTEAAPTPAAEPTAVADAPSEAATEEEPKSFLDRLAASLGADDETAESAADAPAQEPSEVAETPAAVAEPVETTEAPEEPAEAEQSDNLFALLFGGQANEAREETEAASEPDAVEPEEAVAAAAPTPVAEPAPAPQPAPVPLPAAPTQATTPTTPQEQTPEAGSPFFRSPASSVPELPQQALLGRSQRQNDPLRRRQGDVVLEVANLPAYWDGDETTGGVWVALPYVPAYRRAVVTNPVNGRTVEANLFWRDPQSGGGSTLLSSQAAAALGVAPGQVANLGVKIIAAD
ncbi:MAG: DUF6778 family protein [Pseudomonadota bacterium]